MEVRDAEVIDKLDEVSNGDKASGVDNMGKNTEIPIPVHLNSILNPDLVNNVFSNNNVRNNSLFEEENRKDMGNPIGNSSKERDATMNDNIVFKS
nr:hypothetical protein [Tanacetum cinerariifolium]